MEEEAKQSILSPSFRCAVAMAGWDKEVLLLATLVVEDTPVRESKHKKRLTNSSNSISRKRKSRRQLADPIPSIVLYRDDDGEVSSHQEVEIMEKESESFVPHEEKKVNTGEEVPVEKEGGKGLPCMLRLREELSCAICLEICYEPSTTPCGHSFCKKCLKCAANKCGKTCPKCRQLIRKGRLDIVNTVLWNTIQLLFPEEVEARKKVEALKASSKKDTSSYRSKLEGILSNTRSINFHNNNISNSSSSNLRSAIEVLEATEDDGSITRRSNRSFGRQFEDVALALRLQREEFLEAFRNS